MKINWLAWGRRWAGGLCLSFAILAIANVETIWDEYHHGDMLNTHLIATVKTRMLPYKSSGPKEAGASAEHSRHVLRPLQSELSQALEDDEIKEENPYAGLASLDALHQIMKAGVTKFRRETYRSPGYQDESGYDMVHYEIEHPDGRTSVILAFVDRTEVIGPHDIGTPDRGVPIVIFMTSKGDAMAYSMFQSGKLIEQSELPTAKAQQLIANRLAEGVPFLSVSR